VKYGAKYVSLKIDDPYEITPERALEVIREKEIADANRLILDFPDAGIQVLNGRYGPYITDKSRNAKIPKDKEPKSLTLEECQTLLAAAPVRTFGKWGRGNKKGLNGKAKAASGKSNEAAAKAATNGQAAPGTAKKRAKGGAATAAATAARGAAGGTSAAAARPAATPAASTRLAAKGAKASAEKKAAAAPKTKPKAKKSSAKKKS
jgi:DNA topoisomerase-1